MQINYYIHAYICTYQILNMGMRIHYILFFFSVLGKGLKNLRGRRLTEQRKGNQQSKKFFASCLGSGFPATCHFK